jgi:iron transport multicopper oxidase
MRTRIRAVVAAAGVLLIASSLAVAAPSPVTADVIRHHNDEGASGWYPDQPGLAPGIVTGGTFGKLFSANVDGQVYAQPIVHSDTLLAVTENNNVYGLDPRTGAQRWTRNVGTPWKAADLNCGDLVPNIGITGTPTVDPATGTAYFVAKAYVSGTSGPAMQQLHAIDIATGVERSNFPVTIAGNADNAPLEPFIATQQLQRPGLLLHQGVVYIGFGGHCDRKPYNGWIIGVNATSGAITARFAAQATGADGSGVWQSGGALVSDGPGRIFFSTGNGHLIPTGPTAGSQPPADLSEAVVRLSVLPTGKLKAADFFTPYDAPILDAKDADFGSGPPVALPTAFAGTPLFGTTANPHLMVAVGKQGSLYLLDRDNLGGYRAGPNGADAALGRYGPFGGVWSTPAVWPGNGGYIYVTHGTGTQSNATGNLKVYRYGTDGNGKPSLFYVTQTADAFGFGSGAPVVTSSGLNGASALVWVIWQPNGSGAGAQLRAYDALPVNGVPRLRWSYPIGTAAKFAPPAVSDGRVYVGTRDGHILGFGSPVDQPLTVSPSSLSFSNTVLGAGSQQTLTLRANEAMTVNSITSNSGDFVLGTPSKSLPVTLEDEEEPEDQLAVPVTFAPKTKGLLSGIITVSIAGKPPVSIAASGLGMLATGDLIAFPGVVSMGGASSTGGSVTASVTFSNIGGAPLTVTSRKLPASGSPFTVTGIPGVGATLAPGSTVVGKVTFAPNKPGVYTDAVALGTNAAPPGDPFWSVALSATALLPGKLQLNTPHGFFGPVRIGRTAAKVVVVKNVGSSAVTITKSKPPFNQNGFNAFEVVEEGLTLTPGMQRAMQVRFTATTPGHFSTTWDLAGDDDTGLHTIVWDAYAVPPQSSYWMVDKVGTVYPFGTAKQLGGPRLPDQSASGLWPTPSGQGYYVLDARGRVFNKGDARYYGQVQPSQMRLFEVAKSMIVTPTGNGYWIITSLGRVLRFGDAPRMSDASGNALKAPIVTAVGSPSGRGYYLVGSDGAIFTYGDARNRGSMAGKHLNKPIVGLVQTPSLLGYWLVASDGGVFAFGDAPFLGSMGNRHLNAPITGMVRYGNGYLMVATDGGLFNFSNQPFVGSLGGRKLPFAVTGVGTYSA